MPSFKNIAAIAALMGLASAMPQAGPYSNGTAGAIGNQGTAVAGTSGPLSTGTASGTSAGAAQANNGTSTGPVSGSNSTTADDSLFCPRLNAQVYLDQNGASFLIQCGTNHFGVIIDVFGNSTIAKRQAAAPANLGDCMTVCDNTAACVGTAFNTAARTCTLYSEVGASYAQNNVDFAVRVASGPAASTIAAGQTATSTQYSTNVVTISSCAPTVTNCPLNAANAGGAVVVTQVVAVASTEYICPTPMVVPASPVACGCAASASTAMLYSASVQSGSTVIVPVTSTIVAVPQPTGTTFSSTNVPASASNSLVTASASLTTVCPGCMPTGSATTSSGLVQFTGAASNIKAAGMGMGAVVAAAALLL